MGRLPNPDAPIPIRRLDLDKTAVPGDGIVPGRRWRRQYEVEFRLGRGLANGTDEVPIQSELPARMHPFQLGHNCVQLVDKHSRPLGPCAVGDVVPIRRCIN